MPLWLLESAMLTTNGADVVTYRDANENTGCACAEAGQARPSMRNGRTASFVCMPRASAEGARVAPGIFPVCRQRRQARRTVAPSVATCDHAPRCYGQW